MEASMRSLWDFIAFKDICSDRTWSISWYRFIESHAAIENFVPQENSVQAIGAETVWYKPT